MPTTARTRSIQGSHAAAIRYGKPEAEDLARELATARISDYIERVVASAPPLTDSQRSRLAALFVGGGTQ